MISKRLARNIEGIINPREMCFRCIRPVELCLCTLIPKFEAHCDLLLLQHPHERKKYHSTSKLLLNVVKNISLQHGVIFDEKDVLASKSKDSFYLLYPGPDAVDASEITLTRNDTLVVIDGTWVEARKIMYRNPFLRALKKISFKDSLRSEYHIRKQPKDFCLSTLECIGHTLKRTSSCPTQHAHYDSLFEAFHKMVERQLAFFPRNQAEKV